MACTFVLVLKLLYQMGLGGLIHHNFKTNRNLSSKLDEVLLKSGGLSVKLVCNDPVMNFS